MLDEGAEEIQPIYPSQTTEGSTLDQTHFMDVYDKLNKLVPHGRSAFPISADEPEQIRQSLLTNIDTLRLGLDDPGARMLSTGLIGRFLKLGRVSDFSKVGELASKLSADYLNQRQSSGSFPDITDPYDSSYQIAENLAKSILPGYDVGATFLYQVVMPSLKKFQISQPGREEFRFNLSYINTMLDTCTPKQRGEIREAILGFFGNPDLKVKKIGQAIVENMWQRFESPHQILGFAELEFAQKVMSNFGFNGPDTETLVKVWDQSDKYGNLNSRYRSNFATICELEFSKPGEGVAKYLFDTGHIKDFSRYPIEMLMKQFKEKEDTASPYGIVIYPYEDRNNDDGRSAGAFYQNLQVFESLFAQLENLGFLIRVAEVESTLEVVSALNSFRHKYGKISFGFIGGHGTTNSIHHGKKSQTPLVAALAINNLGRQTEITTSDEVNRKGATALQLAFVPNPSIILVSCSTGQEFGIAQAISKLGATVSAPDKPSNIKSVVVEMDSERRLNFKVEYYPFQEEGGTENPLVQYSAGKKRD